MKVVQINTTPNGSTGSIMMNIHKYLKKNGHESYVVWGRGRKVNNENEIYMNDLIGVYFHAIHSRITGKVGFASKKATKKLLKKLDVIKPDIIHLHNIHGYYINIELLFNYIKEKNIRLVWTLHDCWAFTGHCTHFDYIECDKWRNHCNNCPIKKEYPKSFTDNSNWCFNKKKEIFNSIDDVTIITPSKWLEDKVKESFLNKYNIQVINNGVDTTIFRKIDKAKLSFRAKYNLDNKKIILGVAAPFTNKKGFNDFIELSKILDENYIIILVGLSEKQIKKIPNNIIGLKRTSNVDELVEIYNSVDVFLNLSVEETYGLTCVEAMSCGTPCIAYNKTALSEIVVKNHGFLVEKNEKSFIQIKNFLKKNISFYNKNVQKKIDTIDDMVKKYYDIYIDNKK